MGYFILIALWVAVCGGVGAAIAGWLGFALGFFFGPLGWALAIIWRLLIRDYHKQTGNGTRHDNDNE